MSMETFSASLIPGMHMIAQLFHQRLSPNPRGKRKKYLLP